MTAKNAKCDAELYQAAMQGGPEAFGPIIGRYQDAVFGIALARLRDFHEAEDTAQQVFVEAFQRLDGLKDPSRLGAWLRSITIHRCIDRLRRQRETPNAEACEMRASDRVQPSVELERRELREQVLAAVGRLSKTQRETTTLFYVNGYSVADVAGMQEVPVGTVKRRLHDARERLKEDLIGMVESTLKSEAPKDDFAGRVFELLSRYRLPRFVPWNQWEAILAELRHIGAEGIEGFAKALESQHSPTRRLAVRALETCDSARTKERVIHLLTAATTDSSKTVRRAAMTGLLAIDVDDGRKRKELLPAVVPLLHDRSNRVRRATATFLHDWACHVPLDEVAKAFVEERVSRVAIERLFRAAVASQVRPELR